MSLTSQTCKNYFQQAEIIAHEQIAEATWRVRVDCPNLAMTSRPGQFAMVRVKDRSDPLLARPLAVYDVFNQHQAPDHWQPTPLAPDNGDAKPKFVDFIYAVAGKFTTTLTSLRPGDDLSLWGPLGNGFQLPATKHLVLIAGGIGQTAPSCWAVNFSPLVHQVRSRFAGVHDTLVFSDTLTTSVTVE